MAVVVLVAVLCVRYFHRYRDDPKLATPAFFPRVVNDDPLAVRLSQTPPLSETEGKMLVIGAGFVGLGMSAALQRHDIPYDHVEQHDNIGGNWRYGVYETTHIISSRRTTEFKDFPMPSNYPDFPSAAQMREYLDNYAAHYHLRDRLVCGVSVLSCVPIDGGRGGWDITMQVSPTGTAPKGVMASLRGGVTAGGQKEALRSGVFASVTASEAATSGATSVITVTRRYKGVVISLGHHWAVRMPVLPGAEKFKGKVMHSKEVWSPSAEFAGKRVLVIGGGNSACDLATEAGRFGKASVISMRRGVWFIPRSFCGKPIVDLMPPWAPMWLQRLMLRAMCRLTFGSYSKNYGLPDPTTRPFDTHPTINNDLLQAIKMGRVRPKPSVRRILGPEQVEFADGTVESFDTIVAATGYQYKIPMLSSDVLPFDDGVPQLFGGMALRGHRHCYVTVGGQVRYGAGPMISIGAQALGHAIKSQDKLVHPMADILIALGDKPLKKSIHCNDVLVDPVESWNKSRDAPSHFAWLPTIERVLIRLGRLPQHPVCDRAGSSSPTAARDRSASPSLITSSPPTAERGQKPRWRHALKGGWEVNK